MRHLPRHDLTHQVFRGGTASPMGALEQSWPNGCHSPGHRAEVPRVGVQICSVREWMDVGVCDVVEVRGCQDLNSWGMVLIFH